MIGEDFYYDEQWLSSYNLKMYDPEESVTFAQRTIEKSQSTSVRNISNHFSTYYPDTNTIQFFIVKDNDDEYLSQSESVLTGNEINNIRAWLESPKTPKELIVSHDDEATTVHYYGVFTNVQPFLVGTICYGLNLTFVCNAPYGFSDIFSYEFNINGGTTPIIITINNNSAEKYEYIKPIITINSISTFSNNSKLTIQNVTDNNYSMEISLPVGLSSVVIDCGKKIVTDGNGELIPLTDIGLVIPAANIYNFITADQYLYYWLRLLPNNNIIKITGASNNRISTVEISTQYILKTGGF